MSGPSSRAKRNQLSFPDAGNGHDLGAAAEAAPTGHDSVTYILAMLKPLTEVAQEQKLRLLAYLLEMAVLEASELEFRLRPDPAPTPVTPIR